MVEQTLSQKTLLDIGKWLATGNIGCSSRTMLSITLGYIEDKPSYPMDASDFSRCIDLIEMVPEVGNHFNRIADSHPVWKVLIEEWSNLVNLLVDDRAKLSGNILETRKKHSNEINLGVMTFLV